LSKLSIAIQQEKGRKRMANVHGTAEFGKILLYTAAFVAFVVIGLTKIPEWISPDSANITVGTGSTARMVN
jgi:hypothetical protein